MTWSPAGERGFTLVELIVATALLLGLMSVTGRVLLDLRTAIDMTTERADLQQRARVAVDALGSHLRAAGAGADHGPAPGPLDRWMPVVLPGKPGDTANLSAGVTTFEVLPSVPSAALRFDLPRGGAAVDLEYRAGCPPPCGFFERMTVLIADAEGDFDLYVLTAVDGGSANVRRLEIGTDDAYARGSAVWPVDLRAIYFEERTRELRSFDGDRSDLPLVNDVADLQMEYLARSPDGSLAALDAASLDDGPWRGSGAAPYDADLLRISVVQVRLRLQAGSAVYRGADQAWFRYPGSAVDPARMIRDLSLHTTITRRNRREDP